MIVRCGWLLRALQKLSSRVVSNVIGEFSNQYASNRAISITQEPATCSIFTPKSTDLLQETLLISCHIFTLLSFVFPIVDNL
ncbi:hypothetical protein L1887_28793 [Cichorium endivia]|nr:hypothetical protein L1887_28793 [Cichorium endivia]